jgi:holo-[acyl-carrier protein] synthase
MGMNDHQLKLGSDLVHIPRLQKSMERYGAAFFLKVLNEAEWAYCCQGNPRHCLPRIAGRLAVKEAVAKALGCGLNGLGWGNGIHWREIEILSADKSAPALRLSGKALLWQQRLNIKAWRVSFSHDKDYAFATVIGIGN